VSAIMCKSECNTQFDYSVSQKKGATLYIIGKVSAVADEPRDALRHGRRVVNKGDCSVCQNCNGRHAVAKKQKIWLS